MREGYHNHGYNVDCLSRNPVRVATLVNKVLYDFYNNDGLALLEDVCGSLCLIVISGNKVYMNHHPDSDACRRVYDFHDSEAFGFFLQKSSGRKTP